MKVIKISLESKIELEKPIVLGMGQFDGLHFAHMYIINKVIDDAKALNVSSAVVTFDPHPDYVLGKRKKEGYLTPLKEKKDILADLGLDYLIVIKFSKEVASLDYEKFEELFLDKLNIKKIIVGFDYHYGKFASGSTETLKRKYNLEVIDEIKYEEIKVGSNLIRQYLEEGKVGKANYLLGRNYYIIGTVSKGSQIGTTLGFKTANISLDSSFYSLKFGVYAVVVSYGGNKYQAICNVGHNPSFNYQEKARVEVHLFDFDKVIYGEQIKVEFIEFLRDEKTYSSKEELMKQINEDIKRTKAILERK